MIREEFKKIIDICSNQEEVRNAEKRITIITCGGPWK